MFQVNEYLSGVGLSPHIDTHSAFDDLIFSLSLAGPCIMEFRRYHNGTWHPLIVEDNCMEEDRLQGCSNFIRKAIFLPPRSMLLLSGEGRYAWHHYIPHHKVLTVHLSAYPMDLDPPLLKMQWTDHFSNSHNSIYLDGCDYKEI